MSQIEKLIEYFNYKRESRPRYMDENEWQKVYWACGFAIETIGDFVKNNENYIEDEDK